jgi:hypothetical protein
MCVLDFHEASIIDINARWETVFLTLSQNSCTSGNIANWLMVAHLSTALV